VLDAYASFRFRDYRFLIAAGFLSSFGLQMLSVAVSWDLYTTTRSAVALGNVGLVQVTPFLLFALFAGHFADRHDRRQIMLVTQVMLLVSCVILALNPGSVSIIYICLFLIATARTFQGPARMAVLPHTVPADTLRNAITWNSSTNEVASVGGPALAGILLASAGSRTVYIVQCCCATLTLLCFYLLRFRSDTAREVLRPTGKSVLEGVRFLWTDKLILSTMSLDLFSVFFGGATTLLPIYAVEILHTGARGLGWLRAAPSIGAVVMALTQAHFLRVHYAGRALLWSVAGFGAATVAFGLSRSLLLSFVTLVIVGALDNISVVLRNSLVQTATPDRLRGRVLAVNNIFISCSNQLGAVESGWTAAWFGPIPSVVAGGMITMMIVGAFAAKFPRLREWRQ